MNDCLSCERMVKAEVEIANLKTEVGGLSAKLDKMLWGMLVTAVSAIGTLIVIITKGAN